MAGAVGSIGIALVSLTAATAAWVLRSKIKSGDTDDSKEDNASSQSWGQKGLAGAVAAVSDTDAYFFLFYH